MVEKGKASGTKTLQFCENVLCANMPKPLKRVDNCFMK